ncbi:MAG: hypothetical protein IJU20_00315 [Clostridia bacterium]|nr:hypothetical protein [Clostridia bacterium]
MRLLTDRLKNKAGIKLKNIYFNIAAAAILAVILFSIYLRKVYRGSSNHCFILYYSQRLYE